jgi:uncharacterized membrane protein
MTDHVHVAIVGFEAGLFGAFGVILARMLAMRFEREIRRQLHRFKRDATEESVNQSPTKTTQQQIGDAMSTDAYVMT